MTIHMDIEQAANALPGDEETPFGPVDAGWKPVRLYPKAHEDGADAEVHVRRTPAAFWRVRSKAKGIDLSTGSGERCGWLAERIALAIAEGMLGLTRLEGASLRGEGRGV